MQVFVYVMLESECKGGGHFGEDSGGDENNDYVGDGAGRIGSDE